MSRIPAARALVHAVTDEQVIATITEAEDELALRRELRRPRGASRSKPPSCPVCHVFVVNISERCRCGYQRDTGYAA